LAGPKGGVGQRVVAHGNTATHLFFTADIFRRHESANPSNHKGLFETGLDKTRYLLPANDTISLCWFNNHESLQENARS
jgi:hypothetical protein